MVWYHRRTHQGASWAFDTGNPLSPEEKNSTWESLAWGTPLPPSIQLSRDLLQYIFGFFCSKMASSCRVSCSSGQRLRASSDGQCQWLHGDSNHQDTLGQPSPKSCTWLQTSHAWYINKLFFCHKLTIFGLVLIKILSCDSPLPADTDYEIVHEVDGDDHVRIDLQRRRGLLWSFGLRATPPFSSRLSQCLMPTKDALQDTNMDSKRLTVLNEQMNSCAKWTGN